MKNQIEQAIALRKDNKADEALVILKNLLIQHPDDPTLNYQLAWTCDFLGKESEAAPYYESALKNGLKEDRKGAFLGLGSTYRCLSEYKKSLQTFNQALTEFPQDKALKVFRSLTLFNLGRTENSISELLILLLDTT
jgi:tetratricopeptide (TPR) repeat protein